MSDSSSKTQSPPHLHLHVGTTTTSATTAATGSESSSHDDSPRGPRRIPKAADGQSGSEQINEACAACKYQRRRCRRDCLLAPYFPADQKLRFLNAHRLFGVSNITKTLKQVEPKYRPDAMRSLIYQAEARAADPVAGCVGIIEELRRQMRHAEMELQFVMQQIAIYRQASGTDGTGGLSDPAAAAAMILPATVNPKMAGQQDDMTAAVAAICAAQHAQQPSIPAGDPSSHQQQLFNYFCYNNGAAGDVATSDDGDGRMQQYGFADGSVKAESPVVALGEQLGQHCQIQASPFVDAFNVKPQILPPATIQYHGPSVAGDVLRPPQKKLKLGAPFKFDHDDVDDEHMQEQQATAGARCHLELGFSSSSFYNA